MKFRVLTKVCRVVITDEPIYFNGKHKDGLADWENRRILISSHVPRDRRLILLARELWQCWRFHSPRSHDIEEECDQFSLVVETLVEDVERQGGTRVLMSLNVGDDLAA